MLRGGTPVRCTGRMNETGLTTQTQDRPMNRVTFRESGEEERSRKQAVDGAGGNERRKALSPIRGAVCHLGKVDCIHYHYLYYYYYYY